MSTESVPSNWRLPDDSPLAQLLGRAPAKLPVPPGKLTERDIAMFERIGVPPDLLEAAHIERVTNEDARERFGITNSASRNLAGLVFPYYSHATGRRVTARLRRDHPEIEDGKPKNKYISAFGDHKHLYFPPGAAEKLQDAETPIVLVESEKSALALTAWAERMGTTLLPVGMGGCWGWRGRIGRVGNAKGVRVDEMGPISDLDCCDGRRVCVLLDANVVTNPMVQAARRDLVKELRKRKCEVKICELPQVENVNGPDDYIGVAGDEAMQAVFDGTTARIENLQDEEWPEPENLGEELPPVPPFDASLLPASLRPMVEDVSDRMQVPPDFPAVAAVATLAGVCGRRALIQPKEHDSSWVIVPNLWGGVVGPPGTMKSPVITCLIAPARAVEAQWRAEYASELSEAASDKLLADLKMRAWEQQYVAAIKNKKDVPIRPDDSIPEPRQKRILTSDATFESLHRLMADNPAGVFVVRDELTGWMASLERQGRESERAFFLECWAGDAGFTMDRIMRGSIHVEHCCVSLFGGIQPARLRAYLADALKDGPSNDGLIQRFQLLVWPDIKPDWTYRDRLPDAGAMRAAEDVYRRIAGMDVDNPLRLRFDPAAQALFVAWLTDLETRLRTSEISLFMQAHLAKYRKLMPALALLFSLADNSLEAVGLHHAQQAADWCEYLAHHARRLYASRISPERLAAISFAQRLVKGWKREAGAFAIRDVYRNEWTGLGTPDEVRAAVRVLEDAGWVRAEKPNKSETGRPSEVYAINPKIGGAHVGD